MLAATMIEPGYRMPMGGVEIEPGYRMPMQQMLGSTPDGELFIKNLWFGDPTPAEQKSVMPGVLSILASAALIGGLLFAIKKA